MDQAKIDALIAQLESAKQSVSTARQKALAGADHSDQAAATLIAGAARIAGLSNAVALLCRNGRAAQSVSLLKSMVVTALAMCWAVSAQDLEEALKQEAGDLEAWTPAQGPAPEADQLEVEGLTDAEAAAAQCVLRRMELPAPGAAACDGPSSEEVLAAAERAMTAAGWAMEKRWPSDFPALS